MSQQIPYIKTEGAGNICLVVKRADLPSGDASAIAAFARAICAPAPAGLGADQLLLVDSQSPLVFGIWNADGSTAKMCGNGARAILRLAETDAWFATPPAPGKSVQLTVSGKEISAERLAEAGSFEVNLGQPNVTDRQEIVLAGVRVPYWPVDVGNKHAVVFCGTRGGDWQLPGDFSLNLWGPRLCDKLNANIEFVINVETKDDRRPAFPLLRVLVWEIGAGATMACGSGAVAVGAAWQKRNKSLQSKFQIEMPGGALVVRLTPFGGFLSGPSSILSRGVFTY